MNDNLIWILLCLAAGAVVVYLSAGRMRTEPQRHRPNFRTRLDLDLMDTLIQAQRYEEAADECRKVLKAYPRDHEAHCFLASTLIAMGDEDAACGELMPMAACARPRDPWVFAQLGFLFAADGRHETARWALDRGLEIFPHDVELLVARSRLSLEENEAIRALGYAQQALLEEPEDQNALWAKIMALEVLESYDEADEALEKLESLSADSQEVALEKTHLELLRGHTDGALDICERELIRSPRSGTLYLARAAVMTRAERYEDALTQISRAEELGEAPETLSWAKLEPLCGLGRAEEAYSLLDGLIRRESPLLQQMKSDAAKRDYPLLTGQPDFANFLEKGMKK